MKKKVKLFLSFIIVMVMTFMVSLKTNIIPTVKAADPADALYVKYKVYDYDDYQNYLYFDAWDTDLAKWLKATKWYDNTDSLEMEELDETHYRVTISTTNNQALIDTANAKWNSSNALQKIKATKDTSKNGYEYYGGYPLDLLGTNSISFTIDLSMDLDNTSGWSDFSQLPISLNQKTKFSPGANVVTEVYIYCSYAIEALTLGLDLSTITDFTTVDEYNDLGTYVNSLASYTTTVIKNGNVVLNFTDMTGSTPVTTVLDSEGYGTHLGNIAFHISDSPASSLVLDLATNDQINYAPTTKSAGYNNSANTDQFISESVTLTIATANNTTTLDSAPTVNSGLSSETTYSDSGETYTGYTASKAAGSTDTTASLYVKDTNSDGSKVTGVASGASIAEAVAALNGNTITGSSGTYSIPVDDIDTGSSAWVAIEVTAENGTDTQIYIVEIPKAESSANTLSTISATSTGSAYGSTVSPTINGTNVTFGVAEDAQSITINNLTVPDGASVTINGQAVNLDNISATVLTTTTNFEIIVTAQDGTPKTYNAKIEKLSTDVSLSNVNVKYDYDGSTHEKGATLSGTTYTISETLNYVVSGFNAVVTPTSSNVQLVKINGVTITGNSGEYSTASEISFGTSTAVVNKEIEIYVKSEFGNEETYKLKVSRAAASNNTTVDTSSVQLVVVDSSGNQVGSNIISSSAWSGTTYTHPSELDYTTAGFKFKLTLPTGATATYTVNGGTSVSLTSDQLTSAINFSGVAKDTKKIVVTVTAQDGVTSTPYTINISREKADADTSYTITAKTSTGVDIPLTKNSDGTYKNTTALSNAISAVKFTVTATSDTSKVYYGQTTTGTDISGIEDQSRNLNTLVNDTVFYYTIVAESGASVECEITITKADADNTTTCTVVAQYWDGSQYVSVPLSGTGTLLTNNTTNNVIPYGASNIEIKITPTKSTTTVYYEGSQVNTTDYVSYDLGSGTSTDIVFDIYTEKNPYSAGTAAGSYTIRITPTPADDNTEHSLYAELADGTVITFVYDGTSLWTVSSSSNTIPYGTTSIKLRFDVTSDTTAVKFGAASAEELKSYSFTSGADINFTLTTQANTTGRTISVRPTTVSANNNTTVTPSAAFDTAFTDVIDLSDVSSTRWINDTAIPYNNTKIYIKFTPDAASGITKISHDGTEYTKADLATKYFTCYTSSQTSFDFDIYTEGSATVAQKTITIDITKQSADNNTNWTVLGKLTDDATVVNITNDTNASDKVPYGTTKIKLSITPTVSTTTVKDSSGVVIPSGTYLTYDLSGVETVLEFKVYTQADTTNGVSKTITIYTEGPDNTITGTLVVKDSAGNVINMNYDASTCTWTNVTSIPYDFDFVKYQFTPDVSTTVAYKGSQKLGSTLWTLYSSANADTTTTGAKVITETLTMYTQAYPEGTAFGMPTVDIKLTTEAPKKISTVDTSSIVVTGVNDGKVYEKDADNSLGNNFKYVIDKEVAGKYYITLTPTDSDATVYYSTDNTNFETLTTNVYDVDNPTAQSFAIGTYANPSALYMTVVAQDGKTYTTYTFNVGDIDRRNSNNNIASIVIDEIPSMATDFNQEDYEYEYEVAYTVTQINITVTKEHSSSVFTSASSNPAGTINLTAGQTKTLTYQLVAENTTVGKLYTIKITRKTGSSDNYLETLSVNSNAVTYDKINDTTIDYVMPSRTATNATLVFTISKGAISYANGASYSNSTDKTLQVSLSPGNVYTFNITVKSELEQIDGGLGKTYTINVYTAQQTHNVLDVTFKDADGNDILNSDGNKFYFDSSDLTGQTFKVPYSVSLLYVDVTLASDSGYGVVKVPASLPFPKSLNVGSNNKITVTVVSEYQNLNSNITDQSTTYTITVEREAASSESRLDSLVVTIGGIDYLVNEFDPDVEKGYKIENIPESATLAVVTYTKKDSKSTVTGDIDDVTLDLANNSRTLRIKCTAEDGTSSHTYEVTIATKTIVLDSNNEITDIKVYGSNDANTDLIDADFVPTNYGPYTINVPGTVSKVNVIVTKAVNTSSVSINGSTGEQNDITLTPGETKAIQVICTAQDGTAGTPYVINVVVAELDDDATLKTFTVNGDNVLPNLTTNEKYVVANSTTSVDIIAEATSSKATVQYTTPVTPLVVGDNYVTVVVTPESGQADAKTYTVIVYRDEDTTLSDLKALVDGQNQITYTGGKEYSFTVPYSTTEVKLEGTTTGNINKLTVTGLGTQQLQPGENVLEVVVTGEAGSTTYKVTVTREAGSVDNFILTYTTEDNKVTESDFRYMNTYTYYVDRSVTTFNPTITYSENATVQWPNNRTIGLGPNNFTIVVTSQTGVANTYNITVYRADMNSTIKDIEALDKRNGVDLEDMNDQSIVDFSETKYQYEITVPYTVQNFFLNVTLDSSYASILLDGQVFSPALLPLDEGENKFTIKVESEMAKYLSGLVGYNDYISSEYTIIINREPADSDATLKELHVLVNGEDKIVNFDPTVTNNPVYNIENIGDTVTSVNIEAVPNKATTTVTGTGIKQLNSLSSADGYVYTYQVISTAEDGTQITYTINITRGPLDLDDDASFDYIKVVDSNNNEYLNAQNFKSETKTYEYTIPYPTQSYSIEIVAHKQSIANPQGVGQWTITDTMLGTTVEHTVYMISESGDTESEKYTIKVTFEAPSDDATLKELKVDGVLVPNFSPEVLEYTISSVMPYSKESVKIEASTTDSSATISSGTGVQTLQVGPNTFNVVVQSQKGSIITYMVHITRDFEDAYLVDISADGTKLLDTSNKPTTFDKAVYEYHASYPWSTIMTSITITVPSADYITGCTNAATQNEGITRTFNNLNLAVGVNEFVITARSAEGKIATYVLLITRKSFETADTDINNIEAELFDKTKETVEDEDFTFKNDYNNSLYQYEYTVPNRVTSLDITVTPERLPNEIEGTLGATSQIFNAENLQVGLNHVVILVTAEDGVTTRTILINVTREKMSYEVDEDAYEYEVEQLEDNEIGKKYKISLGDKTASTIEDYAKYIKYKVDDKLEVKVLSDTSSDDCTEVLVAISDGDETEYVTFELSTSAAGSITLPKLVKDYLHWFLLAIAILILIIILVCVNRDKYGSINKNRKKTS